MISNNLCIGNWVHSKITMAGNVVPYYTVTLLVPYTEATVLLFVK